MNTGCRGALQILRFNWPQYAAGFVCLAAGAAALFLSRGFPFARTAVAAAIVGVAYLLVGSIVVSHWFMIVPSFGNGSGLPGICRPRRSIPPTYMPGSMKRALRSGGFFQKQRSLPGTCTDPGP